MIETDFHIKKTNNASSEIIRIALEQIDYVLFQLTNVGKDPHIAIHEIRKCFKRLRAIMLLIRFETGDEYCKQESVFFRNLGRKLSQLRDSTVHMEICESIKSTLISKISEDEYAEVIRKLLANRDQIFRDQKHIKEIFKEMGSLLKQRRSTITSLPMSNNDLSTYFNGIQKTFDQGKRDMERATQQQSNINIHSWRKQVKYFWYQMDLIQDYLNEDGIKYIPILDDLSDLLGKEHDLAELTELFITHEAFSPYPSYFLSILEIIKMERKSLQKKAWDMGSIIYNANAGEFIKSITS